jgi:hypothetical protein
LKPEFHDDWQNPETDPSGHGAYDFPFEQVFERLDGPQQPDGDDRLADAMRALLSWASDVRLGHRSASRIIASRTVAMLWVIAPSEFGGRSLRRIARDSELDLNHLKRATAAFSRQFGIRSHGQSHAWNYRPAKTPTTGPESRTPTDGPPTRQSPSCGQPATRRPVPVDDRKVNVKQGNRQKMPKESFAGEGLDGGSKSFPRTRSADQIPPVP